MKTRCNRGGALLAVMWLSAALAAIAFSLANTVRAETERTSTSVDGLRTYYLAAGALERGILYLHWAPKQPLGPDRRRRYYSPGDIFIPLTFPSGEAQVQVIPEAAKLDVNHALPVELMQLVANLGVPGAQAEQIAAGIVEWRTPAPQDPTSPLLGPSFQPRHASIEEIEELLLVRGVTPDLFYGGYDRDNEGRLVPRAGLADCLSVFGSTGPIDANNAQPAVLAAIGVSPDSIAQIVTRRRLAPFRDPGELAGLVSGSGAGRVRVGGKSIFTLRATARMRLANGQFSDLRRTVAATVKFLPNGEEQPPIQVLRWYDNTWTQ